MTTQTQVVQQTVMQAQNTQMQVWLSPTSNSHIPAHLQKPWASLCQQMQTEVQQALNKEYMDKLCAAMEPKQLDDETLKDTVLLIVLQKIRNILDKILSQFPPGITEEANRVMDEIDKELKGAVHGEQGKAAPSSGNFFSRLFG